MKRSLVSVLSWLLVIAMLASVMPMAAFADAGTHEHYDASTANGLSSHMKEVTDLTVEGTCKNGESKTYKCDICGYTTPALTKPRDLNGAGANYVIDKDKTDSDQVTYVCTNCGDVRVCKLHAGANANDPTADSNHQWVNHVENPTCTAYGYTYLTCNVDGCTLTKIVAGSYVAPSHNFTDWTITKYATSGENGQEQRTCLTCGHVETRSTNKTAPTAYKARVRYDLTPVYEKDSTAGGAKYLLAKGFEFTPVDTFVDGDTWCAFTSSALGSGTYYVKTSSIELNPSSLPTSTAYQGLKYVGTIKSSIPMKVRRSYTTDSAEISSLPYNSTVYVYEKRSDGWMRIKPTADEWILATGDDIVLVPVIGAGELAPADTRKVIDTGTVVAEGGIKVRESAGTSGKEAGSLPKGTKITFYEAHVTVGGLKWGVILKADFAKYGLSSTKDRLYVDLSSVALESLGGKTPNGGVATGTGTVSSSIRLNVRKEPKVTPTNKVGSLANGTKVTLYEIRDGWGRINQDGLAGWISMQYVVMDSTSTDGGATTAENNAKIVNCSRAVNVRKAAKVTSQLVGTIPVGTRVVVTEKNGDWYHVSGRGWVYKDYITLDDGALDDKNSTVDPSTPIVTHTNVTVNAEVKATAGLEVLASPKNGAAVLAKMPTRADFSVTDRTITNGQNWAKVSFDDLVGWVKADTSSITYPAVSGTVNVTSINIYAAPNVDSSTKGILGSGTKVAIEQNSQSCDGVYVWGKLQNVSGYVMLHQLKLDVKPVGSVDSLTVSPAVSGVVNASVEMKAKPDATSATVLTLEKNAKVSFTEWKYAGGITWGKVTKGSFTGWLNVSKLDQDSVSGTASTDAVNLYASIDSTQVQQVLRKSAKVTVSQRLLKDNAVWGKIRTTDGKTYWGNLAGITLAGATTTPDTGNNGNTGNTGNTGNNGGTVTTPTTGTAGTVVNTDSLNVRSAAGARNNKVTTLKRGTAVTVYEQTTQDGALWGRIDQGWVAMSYIDLSSKSTGTSSAVTGGVSTGGTTIMTTVPTGAVAVGFVNYVNEINIRSGAGQGYGKVGTLKKGANVVIYEQKLSGGMIWGRIDQGWICTSYVTMTGASVTGAGTAGTVARCFFTVNVRSAPGVGNALVGKIMVNSRVEILETREYSGETWGRTSVGWVSMNYVLLDGASAQ